MYDISMGKSKKVKSSGEFAKKPDVTELGYRPTFCILYLIIFF